MALVYGTILFLNVDRLVDLAAIETFLAYHHNKESPVIAVLADVCDAFDLRCKNCLLYGCSLCMVGTSRLFIHLRLKVGFGFKFLWSLVMQLLVLF